MQALFDSSTVREAVRTVKPRRASARTTSGAIPHYGSNLFPTKELPFKSGRSETVVIGGRRHFPLVPQAFTDAGIKQILFVGWGSQGPAQAQNLRDTLKSVNSKIKVCVGLRPESKGIPAALGAGFNESTGTLGDPYQLANKSDLIISLVSDGGMVQIYQDLFNAAKPGAIMGISHGFIVQHLQSLGLDLPSNLDFAMVAPKGMGPSVRKLYLQGLETAGAGINSSVAIRSINPERYNLVREVANAWSVGIGSPVTFGTDFIPEVTSDLFGERSMLLGGLWGMSEALFEYFSGGLEENYTAAFRAASSCITGTVTDLLSRHGIKGFYLRLSPSLKEHFQEGYILGYPVFDGVMDEIYQEVSSAREIQKVVRATSELAFRPMNNIEDVSPMWKHARKESLYLEEVAINQNSAFAAGVYVSGLMAQMHTLLHHKHNVSEVVNESFIEAVDSLTPYMHARGVAYMVDNCSTTARLGTRLWGPVFRNELQKALGARPTDEAAMKHCMDTLLDNPLHDDIKMCMENRPTVRIAISKA